MRKYLLFFFLTLTFFGQKSLAQAERISIADDGTQGDGISAHPSISANGQFVVFSSAATNLVPNDTNAGRDIFVYDRGNNSIERVSVSSSGAQADRGSSARPNISADGRYAVFSSGATNLVTGDLNGRNDAFIYDRDTDTIELLSVSNAGVQGNANTFSPSVSENGRYVTFESGATNLVSGDVNGDDDVFVYDRDTDQIRRVSLSDADPAIGGDGESGDPRVSADGSAIVFISAATNLVASDANGVADIFVYDMNTDDIERLSVSSSGAEANGDSLRRPSISADGRYVTFASDASNLTSPDTNAATDIFVYDRINDAIELVSISNEGVQGDGNSFDPRISGDGRYISFASDASNLVDGDTNGVADVFVYDRSTSEIALVSANDGTVGDGESPNTSISGNGQIIAFASDASNLVDNDSNGVSDIFVSSNALFATVPVPINSPWSLLLLSAFLVSTLRWSKANSRR